MQILPDSEVISKLREIGRQWKSLRLKERQVIHMEMAAFQGIKVYNTLLRSLVANADSIGINGQELLIMDTFFKRKTLRIIANAYSDANIMLSTAFSIIEELKKNKYATSRIHIHAYKEHYLCYKGEF